MPRLACALAAIVVAVGLCFEMRASAQVGQLYMFEDIGSPGADYVGGTSINDKGEIGGTLTMPDGIDHAFRYSTDHGLEILDAPAAPDGYEVVEMFGSGINNAGDVVGTVIFTPEAATGFVARRGQPTQFLFDANGAPVVYFARAINDAGVVTGSGYGPNTLRWYPTGTFDDLGDGQTNTAAWGINASGQLAGTQNRIVNDTIISTAFRYTDGMGFVDLGTLGYGSAGMAINSAGVVAGDSEIQPTVPHAYRASPGQPMQDLGTLGGSSSVAFGINDAGTVVGSAAVPNMGGHAFVYSDVEGMIDLNDRVVPGTPALDTAWGINRSGQIVVTYLFGGKTRTARLTPMTVAYGVSVLSDQTKVHRIGSTVPLKVILIDQSGQNVSSPAITLTANSLVQISTQTSGVLDASGNANPDNNFRYDASAGAYIYNLSTRGLTTGVWELRFVAGEDPSPHSVQFQVK